MAYFQCRSDLLTLLERGEADEIDECLTAKELLGLPEEVRREYVLYRWDEPLGSREVIQKMADTLRHQMVCFERSLAVSGHSPPCLQASDVRVLYRVS